MGEAPDGVSGSVEPGQPDGRAQVERLEHRADVLRDDLGDLVGELERRGHELARRYLKPFALVVAFGLGVVVSLRWRDGRRARRRRAKLRHARS